MYTPLPLADLRKDYSLAGLAEKDLARDPFRQFEKWFQEAEASKLVEPNAMILACATRDGRPSARTMLLKAVDGRGFVFYPDCAHDVLSTFIYHCPVSTRIATSQSSKISSLAIFTRTPSTPGNCISRCASLPIRLSSRFRCSAVHSLMMIWRTLR